MPPGRSIQGVEAVAGVIIVKLMFWPPCTQTGNICVVDGWSVAGLAATILGVATTVLAILGAVAVAAWWTSLNDRVNDQVKRLYEAQQKEVNAQVDLLLKEQQKKVVDQLAALHERFVIAHTGVERALDLAEQAYRNAETESKLLHSTDVDVGTVEGTVTEQAHEYQVGGAVEELVDGEGMSEAMGMAVWHLCKVAKRVQEFPPPLLVGPGGAPRTYSEAFLLLIKGFRPHFPLHISLFFA